MGTRFKPRKGQPGKFDKPPYRVVEGQPIIKADKTDPANWSTYEEARAALQRGEVNAIGIVLMTDDPFYVADFDEIIDNDTGEIDETAAQIIHTQSTYSELSCSGAGVHVIGLGEKPTYAGCKSNALGFGVEVYNAKRFLVITGNRLLGTPAEPAPRQRELSELCGRLFPKQEKMAKGSRHSSPVGLNDEELLERARNSRTGARFRRLYDLGDTSGFSSPSEADYSLLNALIFWTAADRERVVRLFESSALFRRFGKHRTYVEISTDNALSTYKGPLYRPRSVERRRRESEATEDPLTPYMELLLNPSAWTGRKGASAYKAYTGLVMLAAEAGIVQDGDELRIGCDLRRLAEVSGTTRKTLSESALPYLVKDLKLVRWRPGKGRRAGVFVMRKPNELTYPNKVSTHFIGVSYGNPEKALETLRLIVRMRRGTDKSAKLLRLGMAAMFTTIALLAAPSRGQTLEELSERTGRSKSDLRTAISRLKSAGVVSEPNRDLFWLTDSFAGAYQECLECSGVTRAERVQRRRHEEDRRRRDEKIPTDKPGNLRGPERMRAALRRYGYPAREDPEQAQPTAPEPPAHKTRDQGVTDAERRRINRLAYEGMSLAWARAEVLKEPIL